MEMGVAPVGSGLDTCGQLRSTMTLAPEKKNNTVHGFVFKFLFVSFSDVRDVGKGTKTGICGRCGKGKKQGPVVNVIHPQPSFR